MTSVQVPQNTGRESIHTSLIDRLTVGPLDRWTVGPLELIDVVDDRPTEEWACVPRGPERTVTRRGV